MPEFQRPVNQISYSNSGTSSQCHTTKNSSAGSIENSCYGSDRRPVNQISHSNSETSSEGHTAKSSMAESSKDSCSGGDLISMAEQADLCENHRKQYKEYTFQEIQAATNNFSPGLKLGEQGYFVAYEGRLKSKTISIKVQKEDGFECSQNFFHEVRDDDLFEIEFNENKLNEDFEVQKPNRNEAMFDQGFKEDGTPAKSPIGYSANKCNLQMLFRKYSIEEIQFGTRSFSEELKIGEGRHGVIYKGRLDFKDAAIKVLKEERFQGSKDLFSKIEFLGNLAHQNVVSLLGYCCHEQIYLAYEYMANGSLEDHLFGKGKNNSPLPWHKRFQMAAQIASALDYLHNIKPNAIIHCDIKPSNIFLDYKNVSRLGDVGIARFVAEHAKSDKDMLPVGTFSYIDPEYQTSGTFSTKSDIYALGIVLLQLLTGKPSLGLHDYVETAIDSGTFYHVLDPLAGEWPLGKAKDIACLALQCAQMRRKHRPNFAEILHVLDKARAFADEFASADASQMFNRRMPTSYG